MTACWLHFEIWYHIPTRPVKGTSPFIIQFNLQPFLTPIHNANAKRTPIGEIPPKAFSLQIVGNLAVLARSALDPWLCAAIFR